MSDSSVKKSPEQVARENIMQVLMGVYDSEEEAKSYFESIPEYTLQERLKKYKEVIDHEFDPQDISGRNFKNCRNLISTLIKWNPPVEMVADLMVYLPERVAYYMVTAEKPYGLNKDFT